MVLAACKSGISNQKLYGKWKYTRVQRPATPSDSLKRYEIEEQAPFIVFNTNNTFRIIWGGQELSRGTFTVNGQNIIIREKLVSGKTREFQFYVSELSDKQIIFETTGAEGSRVTAVKE